MRTSGREWLSVSTRRKQSRPPRHAYCAFVHERDDCAGSRIGCGVTELRVVGSMHERKQLMVDLSDGFTADVRDAIQSGREQIDLAEKHRQGLSIAMVTHDPAVAARASRIVRLVDGCVVH